MGADYQLTCYNRTKAYRAPDSLKEVHPLGHAPILEADGRTLIESGFIIEYLLKHHMTKSSSQLSDDNEAAWENYTFNALQKAVMLPLVMRLVFHFKVVQQSPMLIKPVSKKIQAQIEKNMVKSSLDPILAMMEKHLEDNQWFAGAEFSAADIQMHLAVL